MIFSYETIGRRIKEIRKKQGLTQLDLAERTDLSFTHISNVERGVKCISLETLINVANALNVTADVILSDCFTNHVAVSKMECTQLFDDCNVYESRIMLDVAKEVKQSLRTNRFLISTIRK